MKKNPVLLVLAAILLIVTACAPPALHLMNSSGMSAETYASSVFTEDRLNATTLSTVSSEFSQTTSLTENSMPIELPTESSSAAFPSVTQPAPTKAETEPATLPPETTQPPHVHAHTLTSARKATCEQDGFSVYTCSCGDSYTQVSKAAGHDWGEWVVVQEPTASTEGIARRVCQNCSGAETQAIDKLPPVQAPEVLEISDAVLMEIRDGFLRLVNLERAQVGVGELTIHAHLDDAAHIRSAECMVSFSHTRPDGTPFHTTIDWEVYPYSLVGENICMTSHVGNGSYTADDAWVGSPEQIEAAYTWMFVLFKNSSGHYANMINESYEHCGIGIDYKQDASSGLPMFYVAHIFGAT